MSKGTIHEVVERLFGVGQISDNEYDRFLIQDLEE